MSAHAVGHTSPVTTIQLLQALCRKAHDNSL